MCSLTKEVEELDLFKGLEFLEEMPDLPQFPITLPAEAVRQFHASSSKSQLLDNFLKDSEKFLDFPFGGLFFGAVCSAATEEDKLDMDPIIVEMEDTPVGEDAEMGAHDMDIDMGPLITATSQHTETLEVCSALPCKSHNKHWTEEEVNLLKTFAKPPTEADMKLFPGRTYRATRSKYYKVRRWS